MRVGTLRCVPWGRRRRWSQATSAAGATPSDRCQEGRSMSINSSCECGTQLTAKDDHAGRRGVCAVCKREFIIPFPDDPWPGHPGVAPVLTRIAADEQPQPKTPSSTKWSGAGPLVTMVADDEPQSEKSSANEAARPFWKDPIVVRGTAVPTLILLAFFGDAVGPGPRTGAGVMQPPERNTVAPGNVVLSSPIPVCRE
jgi:hypothetical protein